MTKKTKVTIPMYPVEVYDQTKSYVTRERDMSNKWSSDDIANSISVTGVGPGKGGWYTEIAVPFPLERGKEYYLVYVTYDTGDSFHRETGRVRYVDLFVTREKAEACAKAIEDHYKIADDSQYRWNSKPRPAKPKGFNDYQVQYKNEANIDTIICPSWIGYFERMTNISVERVVSRYNQDDEVPKDGGLIRYNY